MDLLVGVYLDVERVPDGAASAGRNRVRLSRRGPFVVHPNLSAGGAERLSELREATDLPIAVGFGVSSGEQARAAAQYADAVVVGSAFVSAAQSGTLDALAREIRAALDEG